MEVWRDGRKAADTQRMVEIERSGARWSIATRGKGKQLLLRENLTEGGYMV